MPCQNRIEGKDNADVSDIQGLKIIPQRRIPDERGTIMNILKSTDSHFQKFGEVYASTVFKDVVKGWSKHRDAAHSYACVFGRIKMVVYDPRKESPTFGNVEEIFLGPDNHSLVVIPPGLWNGFKGLAEPFSVVVICATHPHDPAEVERLAPGDESIPYNWRLEYK
jgi:dTDP-4-dehydrorhamnose 3,5-epimerase